MLSIRAVLKTFFQHIFGMKSFSCLTAKKLTRNSITLLINKLFSFSLISLYFCNDFSNYNRLRYSRLCADIPLARYEIVGMPLILNVLNLTTEGWAPDTEVRTTSKHTKKRNYNRHSQR